MRIILLAILSISNLYAQTRTSLDPGAATALLNSAGQTLDLTSGPKTFNYGGQCYTVSCNPSACMTTGAARIGSTTSCAPSVCSTSKIYVPTSSAGEFNSFINNIQSNIPGISIASAPGSCAALAEPVEEATWNVSGYGSCQADCFKYRTRSCSTGNDSDCTPGPWQNSQACSPGEGLCAAACTYPNNVNSVSDCTNACPGGPTRMCATGTNPNAILCPAGETCHCQAGSFCLRVDPDPDPTPNCNCYNVPVQPSDVCQGHTVYYADSCGNSNACPVVGTAPNVYGQATQCLATQAGP